MTEPLAPGLIYVLSAVHNRRAITEAFVRCLAAQLDRDFHLVLVDDGSTDGTAEMARSIVIDTTVIRGTGNLWWAGCLQKARDWLATVPAREHDLVLIINDDTTFGPEFLAAARRVMADAGRAMLLAQLWSLQTGSLKELGAHVDWRALTFTPAVRVEDINCFSTRGLFMRRSDFKELGNFHTRLLPHYASDYELTLRAARRGLRFQSDPDVRLVANETATGIHRPATDSRINYLRSTLTRRSALNPFHWTAFLLLACPRRYLVRNLIRVWVRFGRGLVLASNGNPS